MFDVNYFINMLKLKNFLKEEDGLGTVEMILILVVLVSLVIIFREQMTSIVGNIFSMITKRVDTFK